VDISHALPSIIEDNNVIKSEETYGVDVSDFTVLQDNEGVKSLQAALNSQPSVNAVHWEQPSFSIQDNLMQFQVLDTLPQPRPTILSSRPMVERREHGEYVNPSEKYLIRDHMMHNQAYTFIEDIQAGDKEKRVRVKSKDAWNEESGPRLCKVCGEKAGKHSYYGGQVCPSCRAFFRRSVQSGYNVTYFCVKEKKCEVNLKTRKNCQFCRYALCEAAGMKTSWVLTDAERKQKFQNRNKSSTSQRGKKISESDTDTESNDDENTACTSKVGKRDKKHLTDKDEALLTSLKTLGEINLASKMSDMDTSLIRKLIRMVAFQVSLDMDGRVQLINVLTERSKKFFKSIPEFSVLCENDKNKVLGQNLPIVSNFHLSLLFRQDKHWTEQLTPLLGSQEITKLDKKLRSLNVSGLDNFRLQFSQFCPAGIISPSSSDLISTLSTLIQDATECLLCSLLLLFTPGSLDLEDWDKLVGAQELFATLLHNYLRDKHAKDSATARERFVKMLGIMEKCQKFQNGLQMNLENQSY